MPKPSESRMWSTLRDAMEGKWHVTRHEDSLTQGIPDLSFGLAGVNGWIELKIAFWPVRLDTPLRIDHFTQQQRAFLYARGMLGGHCWLLVKIEREWFLFDHINQKRVGVCNQIEFRKLALRTWNGTPPRDEFFSAITNHSVETFRDK